MRDDQSSRLVVMVDLLAMIFGESIKRMGSNLVADVVDVVVFD